MAKPVEKVVGNERDEKWRHAVNTDTFQAIESYFHSEKEYEFAGYDVLELGPERENDYMVVFRFDDDREDTILEAVLTFRDDGLVDTKITRDFISDNEIVRTEIFDVQNGDVVKHREVE
ncbi:hypothetical protein [Haloplanus rubicundus]|uniref:Uncharacterized protein n=1 Tax=Haloplanus rubicundus TaxID=1547898 RepID=A0A345EF90_9EURY|nr:hypothetical protein [Haloplanus rubicundus]AXG10862.1 hypothetical protein DU484_13970 [Haloplanus rubicundus]